jgi:hypothetical protein
MDAIVWIQKTVQISFLCGTNKSILEIRRTSKNIKLVQRQTEKNKDGKLRQQI